VEPENSFPCSHPPAVGLCPEPDESSEGFHDAVLTERVGVAMMLLAHTREVFVSNLGRTLAILTGFPWVSSVPPGKVGIIPVYSSA
jgi:hypothetical protein